MVQVNGIPRPLMQRFNRDFAGRVKYSTLWPSRRDSPSEARRAMPTSGDFSGSANKGRFDIFAVCSPIMCLLYRSCQELVRPSQVARGNDFNFEFLTRSASMKTLLERSAILTELRSDGIVKFREEVVVGIQAIHRLPR